MKNVLIHYINISPETNFNKINLNLLLENKCNNFFSHSINYFNDLKNQCPNICKNNSHLFIPYRDMSLRPIETLPYKENQSKKYLSAFFDINNNISFNLFIENYKDFIKKINGKNFFNNIEIFIRENTVDQYSEVLEVEVPNCSEIDEVKLEK